MNISVNCIDNEDVSSLGTNEKSRAGIAGFDLWLSKIEGYKPSEVSNIVSKNTSFNRNDNQSSNIDTPNFMEITADKIWSQLKCETDDIFLDINIKPTLWCR